YQDQEGYETCKELLEAWVITDCFTFQDLLVDCFPLPWYIVCDQGDGQVHFLLSKLNPSTMHMTTSMYSMVAGTGTGPVIFTDDVNLWVFMEHLKHL
ncbi:hypothetical protein PISMIDRAFT_55267, partial [Pisolithus microcarpus 441]